MIFKYKVISRSKYQDINLSRWNPTVSRGQRVNVIASLEQIEEKREVEKRKILNEENQQYLQKRLRTDFSV